MGNKVALYVEKLKSMKDWDSFLLKESGLPGPRGNIELAQAFADVAEESLIKSYISINPAEAPENSQAIPDVLRYSRTWDFSQQEQIRLFETT